MADQGKCVRVTRAAKKRAASGIELEKQQSPNKKRVVLGELPTNSNIVVLVSPPLKSETQKPKCRKAKSKVKKALLIEKPKTTEDDAGIDIDANSDDPQMCGPYVSDIYQYFHTMEVDPKKRPLPGYIEKVQKDWLVEVAEEYKLVSDTLYLTISYLDRFLSFNVLNRQRLQLITWCFFHAHCLKV